MRPLAALAVLLALALASPARAQLGLDLGAPATDAKKAAPKKKAEPKKAEPRKPEPKPAETKPAEPTKAAPPARTEAPVPLPPPPAAARGEAKARLEAARALADQKKYDEAALAFDAILREPGLADGHDEARYQLARTLSLAGLNHSALGYFDEILERGPSRTRYFHSALEWLFKVSGSMSSEQEVLPRVARYARDGAPPEYQDRFHYLLAKYEFERGHALDEAGKTEEARTSWREASRLAGQVRQEAGATTAKAARAEDDGDIYGRAQFIDGLARFALGDEQSASEKFKEVVRLTNPKKGRAGEALLPLEALLPGLPKVILTETGEGRVQRGRPLAPGDIQRSLPPETDAADATDTCRLFSLTGRLLGLARPGPEPESLFPFLILAP